MIQVDIHTAVASFSEAQEFLANSIAIVVANDAVSVFTRLFQIRIVISILLLFFLIFLNFFHQNLHSLTNESILWEASDIKASSVQEKNADRENKKTNNSMSKGSILVNIILKN